MKKWLLSMACLLSHHHLFPWGFYAHRQINYYAVFMLPPNMLVFYKPHLAWLTEHAVDPDKRRYMVAAEGARHYIDMDHYGKYPFDSLPHEWKQAIEKYGADSLQAHGIVPWYINTMLHRLTTAFKEKNGAGILKLSADIGHYIADAHVPLHTSSNHNGQFTNQQGIHGFWESRIPELMAASQWDFFLGKAQYLAHPQTFIWTRVLESAAAADSVLALEKILSNQFPAGRKFSFEERNGKVIRQYAAAYCIAYNKLLNNMIERRMRQSIEAVASCWYTAWVNAGEPDLGALNNQPFAPNDQDELDSLNKAWTRGQLLGRGCE